MLSVQQLDAQSPVKIDKWLDVESEECRDKDSDHALTKKWIKMLMSGDDPQLFTDNFGRIWGKENFILSISITVPNCMGFGCPPRLPTKISYRKI